MIKLVITTFLFILGLANVQAQVAGAYKSDSKEKYFPTLLCLSEESEFIYTEEMDKNHVNSIYIEKGNYTINQDTLLLNVEKVGFTDGSLTKEEYLRKALIKDERIKLINDSVGVWLDLKFTSRRKVMRKCEQF